MKRLSVCLAALFFGLAAPAFAHLNAQYCFGSSPVTCQYLADTALQQGTTHWSYSSGSGQSNVSDPCAWGGGTSGAADLDPGDSVFQTVDTDEFPVWGVRLDLYKTSTSVTANDYFIVNVRNFTTLQHETHYVEASDYAGLCGSAISIPLNYDYSDASVRVKVEKYSGATATMYVDNIALFGASF